MKRIALFSLALILFTPLLLNAQLKLENIMRGDDFIGHQPENAFWSWDSKRIYFSWNPGNEPGNSLFYWESGRPSVHTAYERDILDSYLSDPEQHGRSQRYYIRSGAIYAFNTQDKKHTLIYQSSTPVRELVFVQNEQLFYFVQAGNLFRFDRSKGSIQQVTNFQKGQETKGDKESDFLSEQQMELFQYIKDEKERKKWRKETREREKAPFPTAIYSGNFFVNNIQLTANEEYVLYRLSQYKSGKETTYADYLTEDGHTQGKPAREKVSINNYSEHKLGIYQLSRDSFYYVDFSHLSGLDEQASYLELYEPTKIADPKPRRIVMSEVVMNEKGDQCVLIVRSQDNKDRWIVSLDLETGKIDELEHQHDPAWIGGPGISSWNFVLGTLGFLEDGESIYFQSEESGFSHLYSMHIHTKKKKQLTSGNWEVRSVQLSRDKKHFYIEANKSHPGNRDLYKLPTKGGELIPILVKDGFHEVSISPDEKQLAVRYSYKNKPWELYIASNKANTECKQITQSSSEAFRAYQWKEPEVIHFKARDENEVYARIYQPESARKNGAAVIFVHGAGYLQNAHNRWSSYSREYMFHNLLVDEGFTVLDIDYRASDGYGRDCRTAIYRHMGGKDLSDQLDGRKLLIEQYGIDSNRVGIYGGSYGGFITLMALLTEPGKFACGAALRSVTDWAHYNHGYTSNILNYPETDPEAYRRSSPIYFAENLSDPLLMLHGVVDDNVQFQDVVRLSQRFIELGKKDWELALFPAEAHGFRKSSSWTDEYRRIHELFLKHLLK
ncbi:MAG: S9 family peptidase [Bacteroidetes bacterium]|nr:MAG: S9 family peptidase [Bacteroidota bacterium]